MQAIVCDVSERMSFRKKIESFHFDFRGFNRLAKRFTKINRFFDRRRFSLRWRRTSESR